MRQELLGNEVDPVLPWVCCQDTFFSCLCFCLFAATWWPGASAGLSALEKPLVSLETEGCRWRDLDLCLLAAGGLSESLLVLVCPMGCADWWVRCIRCLPGLLVEEGGDNVGDCSPDAWSSMNRPRLPCGLLLTVFAAGDGLLASCWPGRSWLLGPAEAPVDRKVLVSTPQHAAELSAQKVFAL